MSEARGLARRFALLTALRWAPAGLFMPVGVLLLAARGLDLPTIGLLSTVYGVAVIALEVPTGALADALGRRVALVASGTLSAAGLALLALGLRPLPLAAGMLLLGSARALGSGPLEAWYVDATLHSEPDADLTPGLAKGHLGEALGLGVGALCGSLLPSVLDWLPGSGDAPVLRMSVPLLVGGAVSLFFTVGVLVLVRDGEHTRPPDVRSVTSGMRRTFGSSASRSLRDGVLRLLLLRAAVVGFAIGAVELLVPLEVADLLGSPEAGATAYGVLATAGFFAVGAGNALAPAMVRLLGSERGVVVAGTLALSCTVLGLAGPAVALVGAAYLGFYILLGANGPVVNGLVHGRLTSRERATVLSVESLVQQVGVTLARLTLPALTLWSGYLAAFGTASVLVVLVAGLLVRIPAGPRTVRRAGCRRRDPAGTPGAAQVT